MYLRASLSALAIASIVACSSAPHEDSEVNVELSGPTPEAKPNLCATANFKCPDAEHCATRGKTATCVADPKCTTDADCYLSRGTCSPYLCTCTAHENSIRQT
jgi:hypothetical protein